MNISDKTKRLLLSVILIMLAAIRVVAQDVTFTAQAPKAVVAGERFRISYTLNSRGAKGFRAPDMSSLNVLAGPSESSAFRSHTVNGKTTQETTITYTYVVVAPNEGEINLDGATVLVGDNQFTSNKLTINVLPPDQATQSQGGRQGQGSAQSGQQSSGQNASTAGADDLFMLATVDKTTVYEQEALLLTYKIYKLPSVDLQTMTNIMPDLKNFLAQEV